MAKASLRPVKEGSIQGIHFYVIFRNGENEGADETINEYGEMFSRIRAYERRETYKSFLKRIGLFDLTRWLYWKFRRRS